MARTDARNACLCALAVIAAFLAVNPFVELSFNDDWSYAYSVQRLLQTGHITYNGWSTASLITQIYWGALFAKVFGFSFTVLRFSTLPFAVGCAVVCYFLARLAGLFPGWALFAALSLGLSPLFLPLATSFMTDIPGLFFILCSLYALCRTAASRRWIAWLTLAIITAMLGGMARQIVWGVPLAILPYLAWLRKHDRRFSIAALIAWLLIVANISFTLTWFAEQPNIILDNPILQSLLSELHHPSVVFDYLLRILLTTCAVILPTTAALTYAHFTGLWHRRRQLLFLHAAILCVTLAILMMLFPAYFSWPWLPDVVTPAGVLDHYELSGTIPQAQPAILTTISAILIIISATISLIAIVRPKRAFVSILRNFFQRPNGQFVWPILTVFTLSYTALLVPRMIQFLMFDRYVLPLFPIAIFAIALRLQNIRPQRGILAIAWTFLALFTCYSLAITQNLLALARARVLAVQTLESAGVPPTAIAAGLEYDCWTQLQVHGEVNQSHIFNTQSRYNPRRGWNSFFNCRYRVEYSTTPQTEPSQFPPIHFISWLPPFHRTIFIDRFINPKWLDPGAPKDIPIPRGIALDFEQI